MYENNKATEMFKRKTYNEYFHKLLQIKTIHEKMFQLLEYVSTFKT